MSSGALFVPDRERWLPTDLARGPWDPGALHGGPVAALAARAAEVCEPDPALEVARLSLELLRPVPVAPLTVTARIARPGRKVQIVDVNVSDGDRHLAWGRVLRIRKLDPASEAAAELASRDQSPAADEPGSQVPPGPDRASASAPIAEGYKGFHNGGAELLFSRGEFGKRGPATVWVRLAVPVVPEEEPSPLQRVAAAADFGNGVSSVLDFTRWVFINPDVTVFLLRPMVGEWVCLQAATQLGVPGIGLARSTLWDRSGMVGHSVQSLLVEPR
ncbi:MAG: thioesterase family protein [Acidimicrobiales bacterium]